MTQIGLGNEVRVADRTGEMELLRRAIELARAGDSTVARVLLVEVCRKNNQSELGWLWLASVARNSKESMACIQQVLRINPANQHALQWQDKLAAEAQPAPAVSAVHAPVVESARVSEPVALQALSEASVAASEVVEAETVPAVAQTQAPVEPETKQVVEAVSSDEIAEPVPAPVEQTQQPLDASPAIVIQAEPLPVRAVSAPEPAESQLNATVRPARPVQVADTLRSAADDVFKSAARKPERTEARRIPTLSCPLCGAVLEVPHRCDTCKAQIWPSDPLQFVLNRQVDRPLLMGIIEKIRQAQESAEKYLRLALACCNLHDFADARLFLKTASQLDSRVCGFAVDRMNEFLNRPVVLVVDDSATIRDVLIRLLGAQNILPVPVSEAWSALSAVKEQSPSAVLLDVTMPMMDGYEVCRLIRSNPGSQNLPVIMVSGNDGLIDKMKGKLAGATDYVSKPFKPEKLLKTIQGHLPKNK